MLRTKSFIVSLNNRFITSTDLLMTKKRVESRGANWREAIAPLYYEKYFLSEVTIM